MSLKVIIGAGSVGVPMARMLAEEGHQVRLVSRRGIGPAQPGIELVTADGTDTNRLVEIAHGAETLYNCAVPAYDRWPELWPPLATSLLTTAERTGAGYVMVGNAYGYGPVQALMTEDLPLAATTTKGRIRAEIWEEAKTANDAGRVRATEVRGHDFLGPGAVSYFTVTVQSSILAGVPAVFFPADLDAPHSWSYTHDTARTAIAAGGNDVSWGQSWHVPSISEASVRQLAAAIAETAGLPAPTLTAMTDAEMQAAAAADPVMAEVVEMLYMTQAPAILDSTHTRRVLGVTSSPLDVVLKEIVEGRTLLTDNGNHS